MPYLTFTLTFYKRQHMRDTKKLTEYAEKAKRKLKENYLFKHLVKAVESGANGTLNYIIKAGPGKGKEPKK